MKVLINLFFVFFFSNLMLAQTAMSLGDLALIHFKNDVGGGNNDNRIGFISRQYIESGTSFTITNKDWNESTDDFVYTNVNHQADITITIDEPVSVGQVFFIEFGTNGTESTVGTVNVAAEIGFNYFEFSNTSGCRKLYVYGSHSAGSHPEWITAVYWNATAQNGYGGDDPNNGNLVFDYSSTSSARNALDLEINGQSEKCGCWTPTVSWSSNATALSNLDFSASLHATFYDKGKWYINTSNSQGVEPCNPAASTGSLAPLTFIADHITFAEYRYGYPGQSGLFEERNVGSTSWNYINSNSANTPDWATLSRARKVTFYESYTLGSFDPAGTNSPEVFEAAEIILVDTLSEHVILTVSPGDRLSIQNKLDYRDSNGGEIPMVYMKSEFDNSGDPHYAQLAPTNSPLLASFRYDVAIQRQGWHHMFSPISTELGDVSFIQAGSTAPMSFLYTGSTRNVYRWNENGASTLWEPALSTDNFSDEPYTIFFFANQVPCYMRVEGFLKVTDQNVTVQESAVNTNSSGNVALGYGAPNWASYTSNNKGWNFYGNPYLSWISTELLMDYYQANMSDVVHSVSLFQPYYQNVINFENYFVHNGTTGDNQAININPFQGFFMQYDQVGGNGSSGLTHGKKARKNEVTDGGIVFKQGEGVVALNASKGGLDFGSIYLDPRESMSALSKDSKSDALHNGGYSNIFSLIYDSTLYKIKVTPELTPGYTFAVAAIFTGAGEEISISNHSDFPSNLSSYLYDRVTGDVWNLNLGPYVYLNDTVFQDYRFDWFVGESTVSLPESFNESHSFGWYMDGGQALLSAENMDEEGEIEITSLTGQLLYKTKARIHGFQIPELRTQGYVVITINRTESFLIPALK